MGQRLEREVGENKHLCLAQGHNSVTPARLEPISVGTSHELLNCGSVFVEWAYKGQTR